MSVTDLEAAPEDVAARLDRIRELQARVRGIEETRAVETHAVLPALARLFPSGGLRSGAAYSVKDSVALAMALMAGASASGSWCGVIGVPEFGAEAAAALGVSLDRTVLVPDPGEHWIAVTSALVDVLPVVVLQAPERVANGDVSRLAARLRRCGSTLVALGSWPRCEARLSVLESKWRGLGLGDGHLVTRQVTVEAALRTGRRRTARLWLSGDRIESADPAAQAPTGVEPAPRLDQVAS
ncbi:MAG TPA: hypothetical protein VK059_00680 [Nocardioidaceae bacterium]|nr:hypothetical protein [Nocardioidaceae bacterium]